MMSASSSFAVTSTLTSTSNNYIRNDATTTNNGSATTVTAGRLSTDPGTVRTLFATSLSGLPAGATITSVTFNLTRAGLGSTASTGGTVNLELYQLTRAFVEASSTWQSYGTGNWTTPGGDFSTLLGTAASDPTVGTGILSFASTPALVAAVQSAYNASTNFSMLMKLENSAESVAVQREFIFYSDDYTTSADRPKLIVEYTVVPEPASALLAAAGLALCARRRR